MPGVAGKFSGAVDVEGEQPADGVLVLRHRIQIAHARSYRLRARCSSGDVFNMSHGLFMYAPRSIKRRRGLFRSRAIRRCNIRQHGPDKSRKTISRCTTSREWGPSRAGRMVPTCTSPYQISQVSKRSSVRRRVSSGIMASPHHAVSWAPTAAMSPAVSWRLSHTAGSAGGSRGRGCMSCRHGGALPG